MTILANYMSSHIFNSQARTVQVHDLDEIITLAQPKETTLIEKIHEQYLREEDDKDSAICLDSLIKPQLIIVDNTFVGIVDIFDKYSGYNIVADGESINDEASDLLASIYVNAIFILKEFRGRGYSTCIANVIAKTYIEQLSAIKKMYPNLDEIEAIVDGDLISETGTKFCLRIASSIEKLKSENKTLDCKFHLEFCATI